jgi:hypothetical protein
MDEDEWIEARLAEAPELTDEQVARLRLLLCERVADQEDAEDIA